MSPLRINDMLSKTKKRSRQYQILRRLKELNHELFTRYMRMPGMIRKQQYKLAQKSIYWEEGRQLILEYFLDGKKSLNCKRCGRLIKRTFVLNHKKYVDAELLTPAFCEILCSSSCHADFHGIKK